MLEIVSLGEFDVRSEIGGRDFIAEPTYPEQGPQITGRLDVEVPGQPVAVLHSERLPEARVVGEYLSSLDAILAVANNNQARRLILNGLLVGTRSSGRG
ncbi:hypothetical protein A2708_00810 [Candidatus Saccharibacteria bacterium RIFCSPHIGHO2_01_FULL_49_21]|nr:MAG: hypothetical protein A2708_00810 [Candidatus Saccharibacteria bacterium RIFCSPHIGHO2_01_FULL_49_21]OGL38593.1 MAG: hypothetical protein A3B63_02705 [Candidatus Saccharibacteria bacterium RIFCSPLOWO2_01_FULL_49_22]